MKCWAESETGGTAVICEKMLQVCAYSSVCVRVSESEGTLSCCCFTALIQADR